MLFNMVYTVGMDKGMGTDMDMDTDMGRHNMDMADNLEQEHFQEPHLKDHL